MEHWEGNDEIHYFWYYDNFYPDMIHDEEDMRYLNFRYSDNKVVPDVLTAYYPYNDLKYNYFLNNRDGTAQINKNL